MSADGTQGNCDYLCGIYSLANELSDDVVQAPNASTVQTAFGLLIRSAEKLGFLDSAHVLQGFEAYELVEIFNRTTVDHQIAKRAFHLAERSGNDASKVTWDLADSILSSSGSLVWFLPQKNHWVLVKPGRAIIDPSPDASCKLADLKDPTICVAILPLETMKKQN